MLWFNSSPPAWHAVSYSCGQTNPSQFNPVELLRYERTAVFIPCRRRVSAYFQLRINMASDTRHSKSIAR
jgi:hypothetical protein